MPQEKVDTSMALCFYVEDYSDLLKLYDNLSMLNNNAFYSYFIVEPPKLSEVIQPHHFEIL